MIRLIVYCLIFNLFMVTQSYCCGGEQGKWQSKDWVVQNYVLFYFAGTDEKDTTAGTDKQIENFKKRYGDTVNIAFIESNEPLKWQEILRKYKVKDKDARAILVSPENGFLWQSNSQIITAKILDEIADSPMREKIARALKNHKIVILAALDTSSGKYRDKEQVIRRAVKIGEEFYKVELPVRVVNINDPKEKFLLKNLGVKEDTKEAVAFILGNGKIISVLQRNITQDNILNTLQLINPSCICELQPFLGYRKDLLLKREK